LTNPRPCLILGYMKTSTYPAWDRAVGGQLEAILRGYNAAGLSAEEITYRLRDDHDVRISRSTTYRWLDHLGLSKAAS
jgi:IS30 family transposase